MHTASVSGDSTSVTKTGEREGIIMIAGEDQLVSCRWGWRGGGPMDAEGDGGCRY
jgi:hypothetical protein